MNRVIAIDGPAGCGKGTISKKISEICNYLYIDTGATYRCIALLAIENNIDINDENKIVELAKKTRIDFDSCGKVYLNGKDVTNKIRSKEVTKIVSPLSSLPKLREVMVELQRNMAKSNDVIIEGRDITTVVFPDADYKFYLDADILTRAERRFKQYQEKGIDMKIDEIIDNIKKRDYNDMNKTVGALIRTDDQIYIDSTNLSIDEVVDKMLKIIRRDEL